MDEISFYHLTNTPFEKALPKLLEKSLAQNKRSLVVLPSEILTNIDSVLWNYRTSFLPHGTKTDKFPERQPIYLSEEVTNPNGAEIIFFYRNINFEKSSNFSKVIYLFDGNNEEEVKEAREHWKQANSLGKNLNYWKQTEKGWEKVS